MRDVSNKEKAMLPKYLTIIPWTDYALLDDDWDGGNVDVGFHVLYAIARALTV